MIKTTQWKPDTCSCVIEYQWDTEEKEETRTHTFKSIIACDIHSSLSGEDAYNAVLAENIQKNEIVNDIVDKLGISHDQVEFEYDENRNLVVKKDNEILNG